MKVYRRVFSPISVNTFVAAGLNGECIVIDCGCYDENEFSQLVRFLEAKKLKPVKLLNTHCHLDHVFGNRFMLERYNLRTCCSEDELTNLKGAVVHAGFFGLSMEEPPDPSDFIKEGDKISAAGLTFKALHVPGHTSGSLAYYCSEGEFVFTGDALFAGGIGRTDLPGGNYETLIRSIKEKILSLPPETVIYPGHGPSSSVGREIESNPWLK
ncbi:MAG TPA: MBL fold metallo-hydrolase [Bacteroidales bacterium]|nr:MBL fold metallo-hydrolase [Bacteroidales bacterium]HRT89696.1 MBL fold metallo-hydrolase [Bacteroidales bacterium]